MISLLLPLVSFSAAPDFEVEPKEVSWEELNKSHFDSAWALSEQHDGTDLLAEMRKLAVQTFEVGEEERCFGDLVKESRGLTAKERKAWLVEVEKRAPALMAAWGDELRELLQTDNLTSTKWKPSKDHPRDGILLAKGWKPNDAASSPWSELSKTPTFEQGAVLFDADLTSIKEVENDYRTYPDHVGADYAAIYPVQEGHLFGADAEENPFRFIQLYFKCDLPFPFSNYECDLRILNSVTEEGYLRTDIFSPSSDFHYMAGRDIFLPVDDSEGGRVAYLLVRDFGFDLDGIPDGSKQVKEALRSSLGNLKRKADRRFEQAEEAVNDLEAVFQGMRVSGKK